MIAVFAISAPILARVDRPELPMQNGRGSDQQHKEERHQKRRYEPLANVEFAGFGYLTACFKVEAGAQCSQSPITARERAVMSAV
jgi:hypothetical protein